MKKVLTIILSTVFALFICTSCNNTGNSKTSEKDLELQKRELELQKKDLELKQKELELKGKEQNTEGDQSLATEKKSPAAPVNNEIDIFLGKWTEDGSQVYTISKKGSLYYLMSDWSNECDTETQGGLYLYAKLKLINGELNGRAECDGTNKNTVIKINGKEIRIINLYGNNMTLHKTH